MSDITLEVRVKNARLKRAILAKWPSYIAFARENGIGYGSLNELLCMRARAVKIEPASGGYDWRDIAWDIATALHLEPEDLWPEQMRYLQIKTSRAEVDLSLEQIAGLMAPPDISRILLGQLSKGLTARQATAVGLHARGLTLEEIGNELGNITRSRAAQIIEKSHRKMRSNAQKNGVEFHDVIEAG